MANIVKDIADAARTLDIQLQLVPADGPDDIASAFSRMAKERADAFIVMPSSMLFGEHRHIVELAADNRLPGMYQAREFVDAGGLMSYGANLDDLFRRSAIYVDKILKGAKPADFGRALGGASSSRCSAARRQRGRSRRARRSAINSGMLVC